MNYAPLADSSIDGEYARVLELFKVLLGGGTSDLEIC